MNTKDLNYLTKAINALSIPESRKAVSVSTVRWLLRTQTKLDDKSKTLLSQWLRDNDNE